ncbi:MAG: N-acetyl sugar amidotransferase [Moraxellaceae bacterium]|nr:N-acetyl sugar amidotransferase [Moraxellaceae bacterium]
MLPESLRRCRRCLLPETYETIEFDDEGICNICRGAEHKQGAIDWGERKQLLDRLVEKFRGKYEYDCIIPFSGGKDSTFQLWYLVTQYKLKPLVVRFNHGFMRQTIQDNNQRTFKKLGVDVLEFTPNWKVVKRLMMESFSRKTDFCWHCHTGIYSYPLRVALRYKVPLVFWGEPQAEITAYYDYLNDEIEYEDDKKFNMLRTLGITAEDMHGMIDSPENPVDKRDLIPYTFPDVKELKQLGYVSVPLGSFIPWDYTRNTEIIKSELGWQSDELEGVPDEINGHGEKIECFMQGTRDYIKFIKRGYSRVAQINAFHVRNGRMESDEAARIDAQFDGTRPPSLDVFLEYMGLEEDEFRKIVTATAIPPYRHDFEKEGQAKPTWDYVKWYREDNRKK